MKKFLFASKTIVYFPNSSIYNHVHLKTPTPPIIIKSYSSEILDEFQRRNSANRAVLKPKYVMLVQRSENETRLAVTAMSFPPKGSSGILIGTGCGAFGQVAWESSSFGDDKESVNDSACEWLWQRRIHDGPVTRCARHKCLSSVVATIGGKTYAIWRQDFDRPIILRSCTVR